MKTIIVAILVAGAVLALPNVSHGQAIWDPNYPQTWPPGAYQPTNRDLPFSHRYGYYSGPAWYFGMSGRQAFYLEYLDRVDRAERFGRPIPPPPAFLTQPPCRRAVRFNEPVPVPAAEPVELAPTPTEVKE